MENRYEITNGSNTNVIYFASSEVKLSYKQKLLKKILKQNAWAKIGDKYIPVCAEVLNYLKFFRNANKTCTMVMHENKQVIFTVSNEDIIYCNYLTTENFDFLHNELKTLIIFDNVSTSFETTKYDQNNSMIVQKQINYLLILNHFASPREILKLIDIDEYLIDTWIKLIDYSFVQPKILFGRDNCYNIFRMIAYNDATNFDVVTKAIQFYGVDSNYGFLSEKTILDKYSGNCLAFDPITKKLFKLIRFNNGAVVLFDPRKIDDNIYVIEQDDKLLLGLIKENMMIKCVNGMINLPEDFTVTVLEKIHIVYTIDSSHVYYLFMVRKNRYNSIMEYLAGLEQLDMMRMVMNRGQNHFMDDILTTNLKNDESHKCILSGDGQNLLFLYGHSDNDNDNENENESESESE